MPKFQTMLPMVVLLGLAGITQAAAAEDCNQALTQSAMTECAGKAYEEADRKLNGVYKQATARLSDLPEVKASLTKAQRAWIAFRDAECEFTNAEAGGGSLYGTLINQCLTEATSRRIETLQGYLDCEEGDLSCPILRD